MCMFNEFRVMFCWRDWNSISANRSWGSFPWWCQISESSSNSSLWHKLAMVLCGEWWHIYSKAWHLASFIVICPSMIFDEAVCQRVCQMATPPARKQPNPVLQGCIMSSQGTIGCFSRHGASFLSPLCNSLCVLAPPQTWIQATAFRRGVGALSLPQSKIQTSDTKNNFLAIACH